MFSIGNEGKFYEKKMGYVDESYEADVSANVSYVSVSKSWYFCLLQSTNMLERNFSEFIAIRNGAVLRQDRNDRMT